ncbi:hypothetical protein [Pseudomonas sp. SMV7]|uniref:hypothetical protein n=1 Tax=Pseudomonas sp. SMV7 TaxID=3390194 RepID=UPI003F8646E0
MRHTSDKFNLDSWRKLLHTHSNFSTAEDCDEFEKLLAIAENNMSKEVATELLKTFSDADDFGTQENTRNILESSEKSIFYPALLDEIKEISERSPEKRWDMTLIGIELYSGHFNTLLDTALRAKEPQRDTFFKIIRSEEFLSNYPEVRKFSHRIP